MLGGHAGQLHVRGTVILPVCRASVALRIRLSLAQFNGVLSEKFMARMALPRKRRPVRAPRSPVPLRPVIHPPVLSGPPPTALCPAAAARIIRAAGSPPHAIRSGDLVPDRDKPFARQHLHPTDHRIIFLKTSSGHLVIASVNDQLSTAN